MDRASVFETAGWEFDSLRAYKISREIIKTWGRSSVGRAPRLQRGCLEFEPPRLHQNFKAFREVRPKIATIPGRYATIMARREGSMKECHQKTSELYSRLAQLVERFAVNEEVVGSIPTPGAKS